jgi:crotonobetainyl-CoA:carnitine CoA-transferase CaiB-like acyl-CoA transferase
MTLASDDRGSAAQLADRLWAELCPDWPAPPLRVIGAGSLPSALAVTDLAVASVATAGRALSALSTAAAVIVDRGLASSWFAGSLTPQGWSLPPAWDPFAGDYRCADGWIRLHTNAPRHRLAALQVLGEPRDRPAVSDAVRGWRGLDLESAVVAAGGCAAQMRTVEQWQQHVQGANVRKEPVIAQRVTEPGARDARGYYSSRPLSGLRVLDMTRVIAGPVATRFLAAVGADVLRLDPPDWDEPALVAELNAGKRSARLDVKTQDGRSRLRELLASADVFVHGLRPDALTRLGFDEEIRRELNPRLIDVAVDAYGWTGPWRGRRGFDSLVQMSCGIAALGAAFYGRDRPTPLAVQALDHATGYLLAAAALRALSVRRDTGQATTARCSLAATAEFLLSAPATDETTPLERTKASLAEQTEWGPAHRSPAPVAIEGVDWGWARPARSLGVGEPRWS